MRASRTSPGPLTDNDGHSIETGSTDTFVPTQNTNPRRGRRVGRCSWAGRTRL